jgi:hypothetical protein
MKPPKGGRSSAIFLILRRKSEIAEKCVEVILPKGAHNPVLIAAGIGEIATPVAGWGGRRLATPNAPPNQNYLKMLEAYLA